MTSRAVSSLPGEGPCHEPHTHVAPPGMPPPADHCGEQRRDGASESRGDTGCHGSTTLQPCRGRTGAPQSPGLQSRRLEKRKTLRPVPCRVVGGLSQKPLHVSPSTSESTPHIPLAWTRRPGGYSVRSRQGSHVSCHPQPRSSPRLQSSRRHTEPRSGPDSFSAQRDPFSTKRPCPTGPQQSPEREAEWQRRALKINSSIKATRTPANQRPPSELWAFTRGWPQPKGFLLEKNQQPCNHSAHENQAPKPPRSSKRPRLLLALSGSSCEKLHP